MKILQVHNIVSHHQLPFAKELISLVGEENFLFAALERPDSERLQNGWKRNYDEDWIIHPNECPDQYRKYEDFWENADIVFCGEKLFTRMQNRINQNKICFYMSERWWKPPIGKARLIHPLFLKSSLNFRKLSKSPYFNYLAIGPFAFQDILTVISHDSNIWSWGYFTELPKHQYQKQVEDTDVLNSISLLWVGRMLNWKRVDLLIKALSRLQRDGESFEITLLGDGPERKSLEKLATKLLKPSTFEFKDFVPFSEIPKLMSENDLYILPSNAYEGWGAVVNEAMSVGCTVIASDKAGASSSLINHGINGLLFKSDSENDLYKCLKLIFNNRELLNKFSTSAQQTMQNLWNPEVAAKRLVELSECILNNKKPPYFINGPLTKLQ